MLGGKTVDANTFVFRKRAPVERLDVLDSARAKQVLVLEGDEESCLRVAGCEGFEGAEIEMIVVVVGDHDEIDRRQILHRDARFDVTSRAEERHGACGIGPGWIREERDVVHLHEHRRVADPGDGGRAVHCVLAQEGAVVRDTCRRSGTSTE